MARFLLYRSLEHHGGLIPKVIAGNVFQDLNLGWTKIIVKCDTEEEAMEIFLKWYLDERYDPDCPLEVEEFPYLYNWIRRKLESPRTIKSSYKFITMKDARALSNGEKGVDLIDGLFRCVTYTMKDGHQICGYFSKFNTQRIRMDGSF